MSLGHFGRAIEAHRAYLKFSEQIGSRLEVQRALATIGRTYLDSAANEDGDANEEYLQRAGA